jgi:hypothetical protein
VFSLIDAITSFCTLVHVGVWRTHLNGTDVAQIANTFILRRNIGELLELGTPKISFFERNEVHSSALLKHENVFYRVKKGDLFGVHTRNGMYSVNGILHDIPSSGIFRVVGGDLAPSLRFIEDNSEY